MKNLQTSSTMIRNPRLNGYSIKTSSKIEKSKSHYDVLASENSPIATDTAQLPSTPMTKSEPPTAKIKCEDGERKPPPPLPSGVPKVKREKMGRTSHAQRAKTSKKFDKHHETLQRIECINDDQFNHYQKHWFSSSMERLKVEDRSREERLEITRYELKRHLRQLLRSNVGKSAILPQLYDWREVLRIPTRLPAAPDTFRAVRSACKVSGCRRHVLPCASHCSLHITLNPDQVLFSYCSAKFVDNTQCSVPVFDILHDIPLCVEHARKRDNQRVSLQQDTKPKKARKKAKPSAMIRPQKRSKKKKKSEDEGMNPVVKGGGASPLVYIGCDRMETIETMEVPNPNNILDASEISDGLMTDVPEDNEELGDDMVNQVLALQGGDALELGNVDHVLVNQASHLLEETDITNVLNTIQADEFNDFFLSRNGEPTREETEELERALAAVDNDVKSLEKLSQSQGLLDNFLLDSDHSLVESFVQSSIVSDVFHNGFTTATGCGENIMVGQTSRLLSVQPNSQ